MRADPVGGWLRALGVMLRLPEAEKREILDELEAHLRERIRDLVLEGVDERDAAARALDELGEAGVLAQRFHRVRNTSHRRLAMNIALIGLVGGSVVLSSVTYFRHAAPAPVAEVVAAAPAAADPAAALAGSIQVSFDQAPLTEAFALMAEKAGKPVLVHWNDLKEQDIHPDTQLTLKTPAPVPHAMLHRLMNEALGLAGGRTLSARFEGAVLEIATRSYFDRLETSLECIDIAGALDGRGEQQAEQIVDLIRSTVEPEIWRDNGGHSVIRTVGNKLFISAPRRILPRVQWIIDQLKGARAGVPAAIATAVEPASPSARVDRSPAVRSFTLSTVGAEEARELLGRIFNVAPSLKQCAVPRMMETDSSQNQLTIHATQDQIVAVERLLAVIDAGRE